MSEVQVPEPPGVLRDRGSELWRNLHATLEFDLHETVVLIEACRTLDRIDGLQTVLDRDGLTTTGSTGQTIVHPAVAEQRQQQASLARLVSQLNLGSAIEGGAAAMSRQISEAAKSAANARWQKSRSARA
ncbi:hypothetical protein [Pseudoclavibacter helvolus]|uniref:hypothetical protein n=1 Tax=Pseudoclavibacter helvolus TaxID=255205 RepID=UPI0008386C1A|nr:hypothetical protein [Pseudoclavibacter helvolus]